jgi:hypothetical protein
MPVVVERQTVIVALGRELSQIGVAWRAMTD